MLKTLRAFALIAALSGAAHAGVVLTPPESNPPAATQDGQMETPLLAQLALTLVALL